MFASFPADLIFSHPINLVLLNDFEVFVGKKKAIMMHMEKSMSNPVLFGLVFFYKFNQLFNGNCTQLVLALSFSFSLFFNFRFQFFFSLFGWLLFTVIHVGLLDFCFSVVVILFFLKPFCNYFAAKFLLPLSSPPHFLSCSPVTLINFWPVDSA